MANLEKQTELILKREGWKILSGADYKDPVTSKPREKDIVATRFGLENNDDIKYVSRLFIECKELPQETEIYLGDDRVNEIGNFILNYNISCDVISEIEEHGKLHFYDYKNIFKIKDGRDDLYKAINQNLQSFSAFRKDTSEERGIYYLVVVFDGKVFCKNENDKIYLENAILQKETIGNVYGSPNRRYFIELVSITQFKEFLDCINLDMQEIDKAIFFYNDKEKKEMEKKRREIKQDKVDSYGP